MLTDVDNAVAERVMGYSQVVDKSQAHLNPNLLQQDYKARNASLFTAAALASSGGAGPHVSGVRQGIPFQLGPH